jgi:serine/threonine protein kinase
VLKFSSHVSQSTEKTSPKMSQVVNQTFFRGALVGKKYSIQRKVGAGSFGELYSAIDTTTNIEVALKTEPIKSRHPQLQYECRVYKALAGGGNFF